MAQVYVKYNPYRLSTLIEVNGREIETDSTLYKFVKGKRLQEWVGEFPGMLANELNTVDFELEFCGMELDWDDFEDAFQTARSMGIVMTAEMKYIKGQEAEDITQKIVDIFDDLKNGPIDALKNDTKLDEAFKRVNDAEFPVRVVATMSSGKSTLINALLGRKLMPSKNAACTAKITEILDNDKGKFTALVYDKEGNVIRETDELTYNIMDKLNGEEQVFKIRAEGNIPFLDAREIALMLVDTPGTNNSQNQEHKNTTYRSINNDSNSLILYVLNGTQLSTNDDNALLSYVAEQISKGGKQVRDRFLFVINKMDEYKTEEDDVGKAIESAKRYLSNHGIEDPQIFPCSASTALNIRSDLRDVDIDNMTEAQKNQLPLGAKETLLRIEKFIGCKSLHLEKYTTLSPSAQRELNFKLKQAQDQNNTKEQALIHCGIYSIESAITAYVKKYAKTKKVKDLIETFQEVLEENQVLAKAKEQIATDEDAAKACRERAAVIREKISGGKEAQEFIQQIEALDPMKAINAKAEALIEKAVEQVSEVFKKCGDTIDNKAVAKQLVEKFAMKSSDSIAVMAIELKNFIDGEFKWNIGQILLGYQEKLKKIDESAGDAQLDFSTSDLIQGELSKMEKNAAAWNSDEFVSDTVDDVGEVEYEERTWYEKVGQEEEEIITGSHEEKIGTKKVKTGSHKEWAGTRTVKNAEKKWWKIFTPKYIKEDVYEEVDDYEDEDVYKTVLDFETIMRNVYEEKTKTIEHFSADVSKMQAGLITTLMKTLEDGTNSACSYAEEQIETMKEQSIERLEKLDGLIQQKYEELEQCTKDQESREEALEKNREILGWMEACRAEIDKILDM